MNWPLLIEGENVNDGKPKQSNCYFSYIFFLYLQTTTGIETVSFESVTVI